MSALPFPSTRRSRACALAVIVAVLLGFLGQLVLQGCAYPEESPRATIERLTGIDIAPSPAVMAAPMPGMMAGHHSHHHSHDGSCPLCPLLQLLAVILASLPVMPGCGTVGRRIRQKPGAPRAPPAIQRLLPPSRGPPCLI
ncbi:DUF2946 family protein [Gluconobacter roseus]|uniref:Uncharacterized protein n=1 Tax=Gluconobacter roseus NBRC 3990 TaxID=1307950 RepID=A0A4Y3MAM9_9PROT|nr:DUF2946 family protein [Gluconobacter roseus]KXV44726.1 permease [Gluconobacter roseus]GEB04946.1 hypothetical protein GRO01_25220 [Gluconobacter roseus NBRC 3990]GLP94508.1 hypothetical protein GCM10007871_24860 [Gluconobacter roseus NBRC 3990]